MASNQSSGGLMGGLNRTTRALTPECSNMANAVMWLGVALIILVIIVSILLIVALVYHYMDVNSLSTTTRTRIVGGLLISSLIITMISVVIGIANVSYKGKIKKCIGANPNP